MNTDSQPTINLTAGQTIRYRHNTVSTLREWFTGVIIDVKPSKALNSLMYRIQPEADERLANLSPLWVMPYQIEAVQVEDAVYDQMPALKAIEAAFVAWEEAYFAGRYDEAGRLSAIHDRLFDAHMARLFPKQKTTTNTPTSSQNSPQSAAPAIQVTSIDSPINQPEMPVERVLEGSGDQPRKPLFSAEAVLSDRDKERINRHVKAAGEQFDKGPLPAPEKRDWREEYPSLITVQQHRIEQSRKNA